jgi:hypothetical protein
LIGIVPILYGTAGTIILAIALHKIKTILVRKPTLRLSFKVKLIQLVFIFLTQAAYTIEFIETLIVPTDQYYTSELVAWTLLLSYLITTLSFLYIGAMMITFTRPYQTADQRLSTSLQIAPLQDLDSYTVRLNAIQAQKEIDEMYQSYDEPSLVESGESFTLNRRIFSEQVEFKVSVYNNEQTYSFHEPLFVSGKSLYS